MRKSVNVVPTRFDTNSPVLYQKKARSFKFTIKEEELLYYLCSENEDPDQLCICCSADVGLLFSHIRKSCFSRDATRFVCVTGFLSSWPRRSRPQDYYTGFQAFQIQRWVSHGSIRADC